MSCFKSFLRNTAGNVSVFFGLTIIPLMIGTGVAIDMGRINHVRTIVQNAADTAAIAGAASKNKSEANLKKTVDDYLKANNAISVLEHVTDIRQELDNDAGTFTVKIKGDIRGSLLSLVGFKNLKIDATSVANTGSQSLELALVLDNTGSMAGSKIADLKSAATRLVEIIENESSSNSEVKMAVVPFAEYVNVGMGKSGASWLDMSGVTPGTWAGCVGSRAAPENLNIAPSGGSYPALGSVACNAPVLPLTDNLNKVKNAISKMTASGWTYIPGGLTWGWNMLDAAEPFTGGKTKEENRRVRGKKAIVLMTDGENTRSLNYPRHNGSDVALANATLEQTCRGVKSDGIEIFTVSFMVPSKTIKDILERCATTPSRYFDAGDAAQLNSAFRQIAQELSAVRLSQ